MPTVDQLPEAGSASATDVTVVVQGGFHRKVRLALLKLALSLTKSDVGLDQVPNLAAGVANGLATLGPDGKLNAGQVPSAVTGALAYQGTWNATTNTPSIPAAAAGNKGWYYKVATAGSTNINGISTWAIGDWLVSNGASWDRIVNSESVSSVAGKTGAVSLSKADVGLGSVDNTPDSSKQVSGPQAAALALKKDILQAEASLVSASTTDLGSVGSENVAITGTTTINSFGTASAGTRKKLRFAASLVLTHNASTGTTNLSGVNITTAAGDFCELLSTGSGKWTMQSYTRADGKALVGSAGAGGLTSASLIAAPTSGMLADQTAIYVLNVYPFTRYRSDGFTLRRIDDSLDDSSAFNRLTNRVEVQGANSGYRYATQTSVVIASTPKPFEGFFVEAQSAADRITFWDQATATASGTKLYEVTSPVVGQWYTLPDALTPLNGIYMEVANGGNKTITIKRGA